MSFKTIKGQDRAVKVLKSYSANSTLQGGYIFSGPQGIGKRLAAKEVAKALNCEKLGPDSCGNCASCQRIEHGQHPDIHIIESAESDIKIEDIRSLQKEISLRPYEGRVKVFIIDNAHWMNEQASNALLKILEEPPRFSLIILVTDKPQLLFKTIVSRCKAVKFSPLARASLEGILKEEYGMENIQAHFLAYFCEGRIGRALSLKDKDILSEKNRVIDAFNFSSRPNLESLDVKDRQEVRVYLNILATWFRDMYLVKVGTSYGQLINIDRKEDLLRSMWRFSYPDLNEILTTIANSLHSLEHRINTTLLLYDLGAILWKG